MRSGYTRRILVRLFSCLYCIEQAEGEVYTVQAKKERDPYPSIQTKQAWSISYLLYSLMAKTVELQY